MKIIHVVGARPNFMKIAPLLQSLQAYPHITNYLVHTGQHYDDNMSAIFFRELNLPMPDLNLDVGSGSHAQQTAQIMLRFEPVLTSQRPDLVVVVGDVNSTLASSLVAAKLHVPVAHIEAGLRSFDRSMPEEINRIVTDVLSTLLFTPSRSASRNLLAEGIPEEKIHFVGNLMVDNLLNAVPPAKARKAWERFYLQPGHYAVLTLHRASNVDEPEKLLGLMKAIREIAKLLPVVFPIHPRTASRLQAAGDLHILTASTGLILTEPLGYLDFLSLLSQAKLVLTDSGGIQAETTVLGVPCLTMRQNTEWPETLESGANRLVSPDPDQLMAEVTRILVHPFEQKPRPEGWDGLAAQRVAKVLSDWSPR
jgi:UDP-N-acetylglucosamine 2-epimerase (non-hydrolysing)